MESRNSPEVDWNESQDDFINAVKSVRDLKVKVLVRGLLCIVAIVFGGMILNSRFQDLSYFLKNNQDPINLGNLRDGKFNPEVISELKSNDYVKYENDVLLFDDEVESEDGGLSFYYSPITNFVVRTERKLPQKDPFQTVELDAWGVDLIVRKMAMPEDLAVSWAGEGRIITFDDSPAWAQGLLQFVARSTREDVSNLRLFLDGDVPSKYKPYAIIFSVVAILVAVSLGLLIRAIVKYRRSMIELRSMREGGI